MANNMIKWESILIGIIIVGIATIAALVSSSQTSMGGNILVILLAGLVVGFLVKNVKNGIVNGAILGVIGGLIKLLITLSLFIVYLLSQIALAQAQGVSLPSEQIWGVVIQQVLLPLLLLFVIDIIVATLSGAVGSLIRTGFEESSVQEAESTYPHTALTVIGYIFGILGGIIGLIIAIYLFTREDSRAKTHALIILGIFVLWFVVGVSVVYPLLQQMLLA